MPATIDLDIKVPHVTRVEGHGNILIDYKQGRLMQAVFEVVEAPRYFESFVRGHKWHELSFITSRICGICSVGHVMTSLKATEAAMDVPIGEQTVILRKLLVDAATLQSHILHVYFLVAPDLVGFGSVFPLIEAAPEVAQRALRMKKLANDMCDVLCGRTIHPTSCYVGGFTAIPDASQLRRMREWLVAGIADVEATVATVRDLALQCADKGILPLDFSRETEYISLRDPNKEEFALYDGNICSSDTGELPDYQYRSVTNEYLPPHSTAKHTKYNRDAYAVGALARVNNNFDLLSAEALEAAAAFGVRKFPVTNPYLNSVAQVIEIAECHHRAIRFIDTLLARGLNPRASVVRPKDIKVQGGTGVGATEVPRGILFHEYTYDDDGVCLSANCIIPTNQNYGNLDRDMQALVPYLIERGKPKDDIRLALEMLVRSYDPCISCSVHMVDVDFVE